jgi:hypothetical protein
MGGCRWSRATTPSCTLVVSIQASVMKPATLHTVCEVSPVHPHHCSLSN